MRLMASGRSTPTAVEYAAADVAARAMRLLRNGCTAKLLSFTTSRDEDEVRTRARTHAHTACMRAQSLPEETVAVQDMIAAAF